jgi:hypothetical protein
MEILCGSSKASGSGVERARLTPGPGDAREFVAAGLFRFAGSFPTISLDEALISLSDDMTAERTK